MPPLSRRGATGVSLLLGLGAGLSFGVAIDIALLLQGGQVPDLIGSLGLPGAIVALVAAFLLGVKAYVTLRANGKNATGDSALNAERRTAAAVEKLLAELAKSRHDTRNALATVHADLVLQLRALAEAVGRLERERR